MANRLLRNIAVSIGAGLAVGFGKAPAARQRHRPRANFYPILNRLEEIETRVARVELAPSHLVAPAPEEIAALGTLVSSQSEDIASLRYDLERIERRNAEQVEALGQKVALLAHHVPANIESSVSAKMIELEHRLRGEFQEIHTRTVDAFAETIEKRVVGRIAALENCLIEQSQHIASLRQKSLQTDDHLQRLLEAVEKLCATAEARSHLSLVSEPQNLGHPEPIAPAPHAESSQAPDVAQEAPARELSSQPVRYVPEPESEPVFAQGVASQRSPSPSPRFGLKPVMAVLGLAILGFRLIR